MNWPEVALGDLATVVRGVTYKKEQASAIPFEGSVPLLRATNIENGLDLEHGLVYVPGSVVRPAQRLVCGDIIVASSSGSVSVVGKSALLRRDWDGTFGAFCAVIRTSNQMDPRLLAIYLRSHAVRTRWSEAARGTNINNLKRGDIDATPVPLPPVDEQRRIVAILEDHLSRLDAAVESLGTARRRLQSMEQVALAACRDGELRGLGEVTEIQGGIQKQQKRSPRANAYPFLRVANVTSQGLDLADVHSIELFDGELDRLRLQKGDLLVVEGNGSASQIGRAALWDGSIDDCVHQNHLIRVRPGGALLPEYLEAVWNSPQNRSSLTAVASSSSGLHTLSVSKLKALSVPVPSLDRQRVLVARVGAVRHARSRLDAALSDAVRRDSALRRSLFSAAFSGRLTGTGDAAQKKLAEKVHADAL